MADLLQPLPLRSLADRVAALRTSPRSRPVLAAAGVVAAVAVLLAVGAAFLRSSSPPPQLTLPKADPGSGPVAAAGASTTEGVPPTTPVTVTVHVAGEVVHPGVYAVASGGRVADAIQVAGGTAADADADQLNLAARLSDGERIYVPKQGEVAPPAATDGAGSAAAGAATGAAAAPLDLNTATAAELEALPGVGPATSKAILTYRSSHGGRFKSVTELLEVPGIGPAKLEALRPLVRV